MHVKSGGWLSWKWIVLWSLWAGRLAWQPTTLVRISSGDLRGFIAHDGSHAAYLGIPYASVGPENRFKAPGPEPKWDGVFEAVEESVRCPQELAAGIMVGRERCLTLNVYTPLEQKPEKLPVMVFIHGGGFFTGSGNRALYGPEYLVSKGVILVAINYRLNIQGFLCLRTKDAPGNAGMKDQVAGLKWVRRNIAAFGGDPDNVTIFGESAGAASVSYHLLSPMSKGLFHKAILQSGSALSPWAYQLRPVYMASLLAKSMGYKTEDPHELYKILSSKSDEELIMTRVPRKEGNLLVSELLYVPCTEIEIEGEEAFMTGLPYDLLSRGEFTKVPLMIGANDEEGYLFAGAENSTTIAKIDVEKSLPKDLIIASSEEKKKVAAKLKNFYIGNEDINAENIAKWSRLHGEPYFNLPVVIETELVAKHSDQPVYSFLFSYGGWRNLAKISTGMPMAQAPGASHADDLFYLFASFGSLLTYIEKDMIDTMTTLWTNFAKIGRPTEDSWWSPVQPADPQALVLSAPRPSPARYQPLLYTDSLRYWHELYSKFRRKEY